MKSTDLKHLPIVMVRAIWTIRRWRHPLPLQAIAHALVAEVLSQFSFKAI